MEIKEQIEFIKRLIEASNAKENLLAVLASLEELNAAKTKQKDNSTIKSASELFMAVPNPDYSFKWDGLSKRNL